MTFGTRLGWGRRPALLVIDMMQAYFTPGAPFDLGSRAAVHGCAAVLAAARAAGIPVVHTLVRYSPDLHDGGVFVQKIPALKVYAGDPGELGAEVPELQPEPGEVVLTKQYASAFFGTSLTSTLVSSGIDTVITTGVSTSGCVRASATDAIQHGFRPIVVSDACGDRTPEIHAANLADLDAKYADVLSVAEVCEHLGGAPVDPP